MSEKIPKNLSDAYMSGWGTAHKGGMRVTSREGDELHAWLKGFDDCTKGSIDGQWALGPELLTSEDKKDKKKKEPPKVFSKEPPTEEFEDSFSDRVSGCSRTCACGRECFDVENDWDWEPGELEELKANADADPDRYVPLVFSCATMTIDHQEWVMGCPCNGARRFQNFIDQHEEQIVKYLNKKRRLALDKLERTKLEETVPNEQADI